MTTQHPEALRLADELDLAPENGIEPQTSEDAAAELRRLHAENEALQAGYAAARLEIESLQDRIKTMAEEHADELMVAHLDGMCAAQPAGAQQPAPSAAAHVGDSLFESWFSEYNPAHRGTKQQMRDAYAAGMGDPKAQPTQAQAGACEWKHDDDDDFWDTECGQSWRFDDGGPKENHMNFCPCCGKPLRIKGGQHGTE